MKNISILIVLLLLSGCAPWPYHYYLPEAKDGDLIHKGPSLIGPDNAIVLKNGAFDIEVRYTGHIKLQLFIPEGLVLKPKDPFLFAKVHSDSAPEKHFVHFKQFGTVSFTKNLVGYERTGLIGRKGTNYTTEIDIGAVSEQFSIRLPTFETENNKVVIFNDVAFTSKISIALMPIN